MNKQFFSARKITYFAILLALVIVLQTFGGSVNIGPVQLNFTLVPIVLGAILLGALGGALLGFACGVVVLIQVIMGLAPFYVVIWTMSPVQTIFTCVVKTTVAGFVAGWVFNLLKRKNVHVAIFVASALVPVVNTSLFIVGCLTMWDAMVAFGGGTDVFAFIIVSLVTFNFFVELGLNLLVSPALYRVIRALDREIVKDNTEEQETSSVQEEKSEQVQDNE